MRTILLEQKVDKDRSFESFGKSNNFSFVIEQRTVTQFFWAAYQYQQLRYASSSSPNGHNSFQECLEDLRKFIINYPNLFRAKS